jgi:hypothetical protein
LQRVLGAGGQSRASGRKPRERDGASRNGNGVEGRRAAEVEAGRRERSDVERRPVGSAAGLKGPVPGGTAGGFGNTESDGRTGSQGQPRTGFGWSGRDSLLARRPELGGRKRTTGEGSEPSERPRMRSGGRRPVGRTDGMPGPDRTPWCAERDLDVGERKRTGGEVDREPATRTPTPRAEPGRVERPGRATRRRRTERSSDGFGRRDPGGRVGGAGRTADARRRKGPRTRAPEGGRRTSRAVGTARRATRDGAILGWSRKAAQEGTGSTNPTGVSG